MFKFFRWIVLAALLGIAGHPIWAAENGRTVKILASFYPMYVMALNVAGGIPGVEVQNLTPPMTGCLHDYSLTAEDMKKINGADFFITNGAGMESFLDRVIAQYPQLQVIKLSRGIELIEGESAEGYNPHVWLSVPNAIREVRALAEALAENDPSRASRYRANADQYIQQLETLDRLLKTELRPFQGERIVTFHEAFPYFAREYGFQIAAVVEREPGSEPNAREMAETIRLIRDQNIRVIFVEPQYPRSSAETIARECGIRIAVLDPAVTGTGAQDDYLVTMRSNLKSLKDSLQK